MLGWGKVNLTGYWFANLFWLGKWFAGCPAVGEIWPYAVNTGDLRQGIVLVGRLYGLDYRGRERDCRGIVGACGEGDKNVLVL